jgi:hypothetical protein
MYVFRDAQRYLRMPLSEVVMDSMPDLVSTHVDATSSHAKSHLPCSSARTAIGKAARSCWPLTQIAELNAATGTGVV